MRVIAIVTVLGTLCLVLLQQFGVTTEIPELDRSVAALIGFLGLP